MFGWGVGWGVCKYCFGWVGWALCLSVSVVFSGYMCFTYGFYRGIFRGVFKQLRRGTLRIFLGCLGFYQKEAFISCTWGPLG